VKNIHFRESVCVLGVLASVLLSTMVSAAQFSATVVSDSQFGAGAAPTHKQICKLSMDTDKLRSDVSMGRKTLTTIVRLDKGVRWMINYATSTYSENPASTFEAPYYTSREAVEKMSGVEKVGPEDVNGLACTKYKVVYPGGSSSQSQPNTNTYWVSDKLGVVVKSEVKARFFTNTVELTNIKEGPQPASWFEIPDGFTRTGAAAAPPPTGNG